MPFQSTLPRGERLTNAVYRDMIIAISIHAPAWGATGAVTRMATAGYISIHAPAWGATTYNGLQIKPMIFQSTLPRGERLM